MRKDENKTSKLIQLFGQNSPPFQLDFFLLLLFFVDDRLDAVFEPFLLWSETFDDLTW